MAELPPGSGVDYREPTCPAATSIDQKQPQLAPASAAVKPPSPPPPLAAGAAAAAGAPSSSSPSAPVPAAPTPVLQPPPLLPPAPAPASQMGEMILRGMQSPFAGLAKLLGNYNLFG